MTPWRAGLAVAGLGLGACTRPAPRPHVVEIRGFAFAPATLELPAGDTVVWINHDVVPHTATREGGEWDSGSLGAEQVWRLVVTGKDSQPYYCAFHPTMRGVLMVR
ncbi:MAG: cupredoxin domain-containing protein [Gemmatimonadales bacterium]